MQGIVRDVDVHGVFPLRGADQSLRRPLLGGQVETALFHTWKCRVAFGGVNQWIGVFGFLVAGKHLAEVLIAGLEARLG
ncbi:hypothetical protein D3C87_1312340 [compost metagenome]